MDLSNATTTEAVFWICALAGSLFFVLRVMMTIVGGFGETSHDTHPSYDASAHDTEVAFKLISLNTISAFVMVFGWSGLAFYNQFESGSAVSVVAAGICGAVVMFLMGYGFRAAMGLQSEGANFSVQQLVGVQAVVYQEIPKSGKGKIQISINGVLREIDAISDNGGAIASFTNVLVSKTVDEHTVSVKAA